MEIKTPNHAIRCNVVSCEYRCHDCDYCSLDRIEVGTHEPHPKMTECTDCKSFRKI